MTVDQIILRKLDFIDKTFIKKNNFFYFRQSLWGSQGKESKVNIAINKKTLDANELLCDNDTVKTYLVTLSFFLKKDDFLNKIFRKKTNFLFPTKFIGISRQVKQGEYRQWPKKL